MNIPNDRLNVWRAFVEQVRAGTFGVNYALSLNDRRWADELIGQIRAQAVLVGHQMEEAGAERPAHLPPVPNTRLNMLDTPANRRYERALQEAWEAAKEVDRERYGETGSDGAAQFIEMVLRRVQMEIYGPTGAKE